VSKFSTKLKIMSHHRWLVIGLASYKAYSNILKF